MYKQIKLQKQILLCDRNYRVILVDYKVFLVIKHRQEHLSAETKVKYCTCQVVELRWLRRSGSQPWTEPSCAHCAPSADWTPPCCPGPCPQPVSAAAHYPLAHSQRRSQSTQSARTLAGARLCQSHSQTTVTKVLIKFDHLRPIHQTLFIQFCVHSLHN